MIRGLIFDLDGTLVDSLPGISVALNHALEELGLPTYSQAEVEGFIGDGLEMLVVRALGADFAERKAEAVAGFQRHYAVDWKTGTHVYPGMLELLEEVFEKGIPMAVLSNKPHLYTVEIVQALFPNHLFEVVRGHEERFPKKPDPTTALQIVAGWELMAGEVAYVGDSTVDLATARAGELVPLIFSWGYGTPDDFPLLDTVEELREAVFGERK